MSPATSTRGGGTINDGKRYAGSVIVGKGSAAPGTGGKFNDKTALEADHNGGRCADDVYFAYSRFTGGGGESIQFARSTDHGATFSSPSKLAQTISDVQFPDIAVTGNSNVYVVFRSSRRERPRGRRGLLREVHRLRRELHQAAAAAALHPLRRGGLERPGGRPAAVAPR